MIERQAMLDLYQVAHDLLTAYKADRDALFAACTVKGDPATMEPDDRAYIAVMDDLIDRASRSIETAWDVLDV